MIAKNRLKTIESVLSSFNELRLGQVLWGILAFASYQLILSIVLRIRGLDRNLSLFPLELLVFALVAICLSLYSTVSALRVRVFRAGVEQRMLQSAQIAAYLSNKLKGFCQGIDHSLSAIMFFTRAQLGGKASPQLERDLREVMERIDQVQLLLSEMQRAVGSIASLDGAGALVPDDSAVPVASVPIPDSVDEYKGAASTYSLRKAARKVVILPITVSYSSEEREMQFHSYTVNVCEDGACIVFSAKGLDSQAEIRIQMPQEFSARARIRWIQPSRENAFRLAGIEFLDQRVKVAAL